MSRLRSDGLRENRGFYETEEQALSVVVERLASHLDPEQIYLFGSRARGNARPDSDFDLLVITRSEDGAAGSDYERAYAPLIGLGIGCDIVPCPMKVFEEERELPTSLCFEAYHHGRKVYERR